MKVETESPLLTRSRLLFLASLINVKHILEVKQMLNYFDKLGSLIFLDEGRRSLEDMITIRDPIWIVPLLNLILSQVKNNSGSTPLERSCITRTQLLELLNNYPAEIVPTIIAILEEFEMIYPIDTHEVSLQSRSYVIPHLLEYVNPETIKTVNELWAQELKNSDKSPQDMNRIIKIYHYMPPQIFPRIISRISQYCRNTARMMWSSGLLVDKIINDQSATILIHHFSAEEGDEIVHTISIQLRGEDVLQTRNIFATVTSIVNVILSPFSLHWKAYYSIANVLIPISEIEKPLRTTLKSHFESKFGLIPFSNIIPEQYIHTYDGPRMHYQDLEIGRVLGDGGFATVYEALYKGEKIAVKQIKAKRESLLDFQQEVAIHGGLANRNIIRLVGICLFPYCLLLEYCQHGNLFTLIHSWDKPFPWNDRLSISLDIAHGLKYLQEKKPYPIAHLDFKSPNMILTEKKGHLRAKIGDFGTSQVNKIEKRGNN